MTTAEMISAFKVNYDIVNLEGPGYEDDEILVLLNQAQVLEVQKEIQLKRLTWISNLIVNELGNSAAGLSYTNTRTYTKTGSEEYIGYIGSKSKVVRATFKVINPADWVDNIPIRKDESGKYVNSTINRVILLNPRIYEDTHDTFTIIHDSLTTFSGASDVYLEYVKRPVAITSGVSSEVDLMLHERIVNTAVNLAKKVFNPNESGGSVQTDAMINKTI